MKRIFKGPWLWIVVAVVGVLLALQYLGPDGGYQEIESSAMQEHIASGDVKEITFIDAGDQAQASRLHSSFEYGVLTMDIYAFN